MSRRARSRWLSRLTALASTSPMVRPASRSSRVASTDPPRASATTSWLDDAWTPAAQLAGDGRPAGDGFEAPDVPAAAHVVDVMGHLDVAEIALLALGTPAQRPAC